MPTSLVEGNSLLAVDVGSTVTRASLFDVVEERYRFIGLGAAPTTAEGPGHDVGVGVRAAIDNLQEMLGRRLLDVDQRLILPAQPDGSGVDAFVSTFSAGPALRTVVLGLLADVSLRSAQRLARSTYSRIVESLGMNDRRKPHEQIDSIIRLNPDLIVITGGTDGGATHTIQKSLEVVGLSAYLLPEGNRPAILYAGNSQLAGEIKAALGGLTPDLHISPNVRPTLEIENLWPASRELAAIHANFIRRRIQGMEELYHWSGKTLIPTAHAYGRMIQFLGQLHGTDRGVLGVDLGASATMVAAALGGNFSLNVFPQYGLGRPLPGILRQVSVEDVMQWIPIDLPADVVRDYIYQKSLYPGGLPATLEDLALEQALARQVLMLAVRAAMSDVPRQAFVRPGLLPPCEPILASGGVLTGAPTAGQTLLMLLDALQPFGLTRLVLDQNNLLPALGAAAEKNIILPVHVMESWSFVNLASVLAPVSGAAIGAPIARLRLTTPDGAETRYEVKQGALELLDLAQGQSARLEVQPLSRTDLGLGPGRPLRAEVTGGVMGLVVDARGRPLRLTPDPVRRRDLLKKWLWTMGG